MRFISKSAMSANIPTFTRGTSHSRIGYMASSAIAGIPVSAILP
jgi:hypothetical protein